MPRMMIIQKCLNTSTTPRLADLSASTETTKKPPRKHQQNIRHITCDFPSKSPSSVLFLIKDQGTRELQQIILLTIQLWLCTWICINTHPECEFQLQKLNLHELGKARYTNVYCTYIHYMCDVCIIYTHILYWVVCQ